MACRGAHKTLAPTSATSAHPEVSALTVLATRSSIFTTNTKLGPRIYSRLHSPLAAPTHPYCLQWKRLFYNMQTSGQPPKQLIHIAALLILALPIPATQPLQVCTDSRFAKPVSLLKLNDMCMPFVPIKTHEHQHHMGNRSC